jgi:hypothetical protein
VDGELVLAPAGDHIHERLADDSDHAIILSMEHLRVVTCR